MDNNIVQTVYDTLTEHNVEISKARAERDKLEAKIKENRYTPQVLKAEIYPKRDAARRNVEDLCAAAMKDARGKINQYRQDAERINDLDPAKLTDDIKLMQSGITLKSRDIQAMIRRNEGNATMLQIILRYAEEHGLDTGGTLYVGGQEEKETARNLDSIISYYEKWIDTDDAQTMLDKFFQVTQE